MLGRIQSISSANHWSRRRSEAEAITMELNPRAILGLPKQPLWSTVRRPLADSSSGFLWCRMAIEDQAALLGSEYERWMRADVQSPVWLPRRWSHLRPPTASEVLNVLDRHPRLPRARGAFANLYEVRETLPAKERLDRHTSERTSGSQSSCDCCNGYTRFNKSATPRRVPTHHCDHPQQSDPPLIQFDHDTWVTTVTESLSLKITEENALQDVKALLRMASPENWCKSAGASKDSFFVESSPGRWNERGGFEPLETPPSELWGSSTGAELLEVTQWHSGFSEDSRAGAVVYLTIKNYVDKIEDPSGPELSFDYVLHHCEKYDLGPAEFKDIIDVDGGHYQGRVRDQTLFVRASKSIHFRASNRGDDDVAILLNLLAPATVSMLMRELVYEGTLQGLNKTAA